MKSIVAVALSVAAATAFAAEPSQPVPSVSPAAVKAAPAAAVQPTPARAVQVGIAKMEKVAGHVPPGATTVKPGAEKEGKAAVKKASQGKQ